jgi:hypothetical protein
VREARVFGLASSAVARVQVLMSDATRRDVPIRETAALGIGGTAYASFAYRFGARDLARGVGPVAVIALDAQGAEIDRQTTGFGG